MRASALADGAGNIQVDTTGQLVTRFTGPREGREISFIDIYGVRLLSALENAPPTVRRSLEVGVSVSQKDQSLTRGEVVGFIRSLEDVALLPSGTTERGEAQFDRWRVNGPDQPMAADMTAKLWLTDRAPVTLLRLADRQNGQLTEAAKRTIVATGISALVRAKAVDLNELVAAAGW